MTAQQHLLRLHGVRLADVIGRSRDIASAGNAHWDKRHGLRWERCGGYVVEVDLLVLFMAACGMERSEMKLETSRTVFRPIIVTIVGLTTAILIAAIIGGFLFRGPSPKSRAREAFGTVSTGGSQSANNGPNATGLKSTDNSLNYVDVHLDNYQIDMPVSLPSGPTRFIVHNNSEIEHNFKIKGNDLERNLTYNIKPYQTTVLAVSLAPGNYTARCSIADHAKQSQALHFTVTSP